MYIVVLVTASGKAEATRIARQLIAKRLAACVNIIGGVESFFRWQGRVDKAKEFLLIIKSRKSKFNQLIRLVKTLHSYEVPEIIALPIAAGEKNYVKWLGECHGKSA